MLTPSVVRPRSLLAGIGLSLVNALVLGVAAVHALGGPFDNSPFAVVFVALALVGPVSALVSYRRSRRRGVSNPASRRRSGTVLVGLGLPVLVVSLFLLIV